ncbi:MAG: DUF2267 domain-containing protein [Halobacteriaceae archaeon]
MPGPQVDAAEALEQVKHLADLDSTEAARETTEAVLRTLGERLARGEAEDLADFLTPDLRAWLLAPENEDAEEFPPEEFVERVAEREGVDTETAHDRVQAVFDGLSLMVREDELDRARTQLPESYHTLLAPAF